MLVDAVFLLSVTLHFEEVITDALRRHNYLPPPPMVSPPYRGGGV
jgi:hypothetical protein